MNRKDERPQVQESLYQRTTTLFTLFASGDHILAGVIAGDPVRALLRVFTVAAGGSELKH
jgi:hypothetical protein